MSRETFAKAMGRVEVDPGFPTDLEPYMTASTPRSLLQEKKISRDAGLEEGAAHRLHGRRRSAGVLTAEQAATNMTGPARTPALSAFWGLPSPRETR